jgi:hypothetical protein
MGNKNPKNLYYRGTGKVQTYSGRKNSLYQLLRLMDKARKTGLHYIKPKIILLLHARKSVNRFPQMK